MSKVTSKLQVTIPKAVAKEYRIKPGSDVLFEPAGEVIRIRIPEREQAPVSLDVDTRLALFDAATERQQDRNASWTGPAGDVAENRGWSREELYDRAVPR